MVGSKIHKSESLGLAGKIYITILLVIFGGVILHTPLSVGFSTLWPNYELLIKSWKEIMMLVAGIMALFLIYKNRKFKILQSPTIIAIVIYAALHLVLSFYMSQGWTAWAAGLAIDLRYLLFFGLVYIALRLFPAQRKLFITVGIAGALIALIFALMQVFILPNDVLKCIGYNLDTISPYLTIDKNPAFIRINGTFRGPNPLGAYAGIVLTILVAAIAKKKINSLYSEDKWQLIIVAILSAGGLVALWASYSRSALIGTAISISIVLAVTTWRKLSTEKWITIGILMILVFGGLFLARDTSFISNVILHENPSGGSSISSNEGHASSLDDGFNHLIHQPLGGGIGSTGSASIIGNKAVIIENQYLFINHEIGWLGLAIFMYIFVSILLGLWSLRRDWLALGIFAGGIGLAIIGILLPVWTDDAVSIIWWGLAAVALGAPTGRRTHDE